MGQYGRHKVEVAAAPIVNYSAKAALGNSSVRDIYGTSVSKTITEVQKIIKVNSLSFFLIN